MANKKEHCKINYNTIFLFGLFMIGIIIRFIISDFSKHIYVYFDELRYYMIAENMATGRGLQLYNTYSDFQKILYCIILSPAFWVSNKIVQLKVIALINAIVMNSGIFPVYFLSKRLIIDKKKQLLTCALFLVASDLAYTMTFMSEVIFVPLSLWLLCLFFYLFDIENNFVAKKRLCCGIGVLIYVLYLNKEIALVFPISYVLCEFSLAFLFKKKAILKVMLHNIFFMFCSFFLCFIFFKLTVFKGMGNSYDQTSIDVLTLPGRFPYMIFGFIHYLISAILAFGIFPVLLPIVQWRRLTDKTKYKFSFLIVILLVSAIVVAYTITVREDFPSNVPRTHLRYVCFLLLPFVIIFASICEQYYQLLSSDLKNGILVFGIFILIVLSCWHGVWDGSSVDQTLLSYGLFFSGKLKYLFAIYFLFICIGLVMAKKRLSLLWKIFIVLFLIIQAINNKVVIEQHYNNYRMENFELREANELKRYIQNNKNKNFLLISGGSDDAQRIFDTYINLSNIRCVDGENLLQRQGADGINLNETVLTSRYGFDYDIIEYDYIILHNRYGIKEDKLTQKIDILNSYYTVYKLKDGNHLPPIQNWWNIQNGKNIFEITSGYFYSEYERNETGSTITSDEIPKYLLYGPYESLPAGCYDFIYRYSYKGNLPENTILGNVDICASNFDLSGYSSSVVAGKNYAIIQNVNIPQDLENFEMRMYTYEPEVTVESVEVIKK